MKSLLVVAAAGSGLAGGVYFAFSAFVMHALGKLPDRDGLRAMQAINTAAPRPALMILLFGTAVACLVLGVQAVRHLEEPAARWQLAGAIAYLASIVLTIAYHVPRNDALGTLDPDVATSAEAWRSYLSAWTAWNHVRTLAGAAAAALLTVAARLA